MLMSFASNIQLSSDRLKVEELHLTMVVAEPREWDEVRKEQRI